MKFIFHIGMGKTGTSSIQSALNNSEKVLEAAKVKYLGMWLGMIEPRFEAIEGINLFFRQPEAQIVLGAKKYISVAQALGDQDGVETVIFSNEGMLNAASALRPFFDEIAAAGDLSIIAYVRHPSSWISSAYTQWGVRHKTYPGPIISFNDRMPQLMQQYENLRPWHTNFSNNLTVRSYDAVSDVVADFAEVTGLPLNLPEARLLERGEDAEVIIRAIFNDRFPMPMLPNRFDRGVLNARQSGGVRSIGEMIDRCFAREGIDEAIARHSDLFDLLRDVYGIDYTTPIPPAEKRKPDPDSIRERLMDYLVEIVLRQSERIAVLERKVAKLVNDEALITPQLERDQTS